MKAISIVSVFVSVALSLNCNAQTKPLITLDEFMNTTEIRGARISPDGSAAVIATRAPDWQQNRFKDELWLWTRSSGKVTMLTNSGHDSSPVWSADGHYIAFLSDRQMTGVEAGDSEKDKDETSRIWIISINGGEAFPLYREKLSVHAFAWSHDSSNIFFSVADPLAKDQEDARKAEWKDVIRWREQERGDVLLALPVESVIHANAKMPEPHKETKAPENRPQYPASASVITRNSFEIAEIVPSPEGEQIAFETGPVSHRLENPAESELFLVGTHGGDVRQLTHNQGLEGHPAWTPSGKSIDLLVRAAGGSIDGPYQDVQGRMYSIDIQSRKVTRLGEDFKGSWEDLIVTYDGTVLATGLTGIDQHLYRIDGSKFDNISTMPGTYSQLDASRRSDALLFTHSGITEPTQAYVAAHLSELKNAKPITSLNPIFGDRAQVDWRPYRWKSTDGTEVEGVLIYPPGKKGAQHLRMLTLIHGGPADADGDRFGADWYNWATLAATNGWLVLRPNYRGSTGYGDAFMLGIMPHLVSAPGQDILTGVDALVKDGIADADHLAIGGYSYGGYMTNWIITQSTRFKAAVTGAGAVEHAANWGNDDLTWDDAWYLSGTPWEKPELYQSEAALFRMNKVTTPTHIVGGNADDRVSYFEQVLLERSLERVNVPHSLLVFPGENHPLDKNPWHGYIKVREELKWLGKYGGD